MQGAATVGTGTTDAWGMPVGAASPVQVDAWGSPAKVSPGTSVSSGQVDPWAPVAAPVKTVAPVTGNFNLNAYIDL